MKTSTKSLLCLLIVLLFTKNLSSQNYIKKKIDFGSQYIYCIYQDHKGFMWFGSNDGLIKYNGATYKKYKYLINDSSSVSSNNINYICEDKDKNLWVSTQNNGINKYIPSEDKFLRFQKTFKFKSRSQSNVIRVLHVDKTGRIWFGSLFGGLNKYNPEKETFERIDNPKDSIQTVFAICEDSKGNVLLSTDKYGIIPFNPKTCEVIENDYIQLVNKLKPYFIERIKKISEHEILFFATGEGIFKYNEKDKTFNQICSENNFNSFCNFDNSECFISTIGGIKTICKKTDRVSRNEVLPCRYSLNYEIQAIFKDKSNCFWVSTVSGGLFQYIPKKDFNHCNSDCKKFPFKERFILDVKEDINKNVWAIIRNKGVYIFNPNTCETEQVKIPKQLSSLRRSTLSKDAKRLYEDKENNIWIGTTKGICFYNIKEKKIKDYYKVPGDLNILKGHFICSIFEDSRSNIWFGTFNSGVFLYKSKTNEIENFETRSNYQVPNNNILTFFENKNGNIWISVWGFGICIYDYRQNTLSKFNELNTPGFELDNAVTTIHRSENDIIWLGTTNQGLIRYDGNIQVYNDSKDLPNNFINCILEDKNNNLWISTDKGVCKYNQKNETFKIYNENDGLLSQSFFHLAGDIGNDGKFYFGGQGGINIFYPEKIKENKYKAPIYITGLKSEKKSLFKSSNVYLDDDSKQIELHHNEATILKFYFASLNYQFPEENIYLYTLKGYEEIWHSVQNQHSATYINVPPGDYKFIVKAKNNDGILNETGDSIKIAITPPIWKTTYAYIIYCILILVFLYIAYRHVKCGINIKRKVKLQNSENEVSDNRNTKRQQLHTDLYYEYKTLHFLVQAPLHEIFKESKQFPVIKKNLKTIKRNSRRLQRFIDPQLKYINYKNEDDKIKLSYINITNVIENFVKDYKTYLNKRFFNITLKNKIKGYKAWFDIDIFERILSNLISDASKYKYPKRDITISLKKLDSSTPIKSISSDYNTFGEYNCEKGIEIEIISKTTGVFSKICKICSKFLIKRENKKFSKNDLYLSYTKKLIKKHRAEISIYKTDKNYCHYILWFPLKKGIYDNNEYSIVESYTENLHRLKDNPAESKLEIKNSKPFDLAVKLKNKLINNKKLVLIIEDNEQFRKKIKKSLSPLYNIITAKNSTKGFKSAFKNNPNIIICDELIDKKSGIKLCKKIKSEIKTCHIPVILLSENNSHENKLKSFEYGADDYLIKPIDTDILKLKIRNRLMIREKLREKFTKNVLVSTHDIASNKTDESFLDKIIKLVYDNISNPEFNINFICKAMGVSRSSLYEKFKELTNLTANEFIKSIRLKKAAELLIKNDLSISDIAYKVGFNDPNYFSRVFSNQFGIPPTKYAESIPEKSTVDY